MLIEVHILKNHTPANLNRDESGSPKDCMFSGVPRARISSQCRKRNIRQSKIFQEVLGENLMGIRTRKMPERIGDMLRERSIAEDFVVAAVLKIANVGKNEKKAEQKAKAGEDKDKDAKFITEQVIFYSNEDLVAITNAIESLINQNIESVEKFKKADMKSFRKKLENKRPVTVDIALFGRMVTDTIMHNVEASVQVAHAISTNKLQKEFDYFTAVDDIMTDINDLGASMIGDIEFNSSCFYDYYNIDMDELIKNLSYGRHDDEKQKIKEIAVQAIMAFLEASIFTTPSGKQNTFAAHQLPSAIYVDIKTRKIPVSMANAFAKPAEATKDLGLDEVSVKKLAEHIDATNNKFFTDVQSSRLWLTTFEQRNPATATIFTNFEQLKNKVQSVISEG